MAASHFLLAMTGLVFTWACGGSASETPYPVRPDAWQFEARRPKRLAEKAEPNQRRPAAGDLEFGNESAPVKATWGSTPSAPTVTPSGTAIDSDQSLQLK